MPKGNPLMRKGLSSLLMLMLVRFVAVDQILSPALQITDTNGVATVSWLNIQTLPLPTFSLQTTTNLSPPVTWNSLLVTSAFGSGTTNVAMAYPQQFFRFAQMLPIFQFAIFYNVNMELDFGLYTIINGPVFSDGSIWAGSQYLTFNSSVAAVRLIATNASDPFTASNADYNGNGSPPASNSWTTRNSTAWTAIKSPVAACSTSSKNSTGRSALFWMPATSSP